VELFLIISATIIFSAFFSGIEIAFVSANKFHIEVENKKGNFAYKVISYLVQNPARFIAAMLVGNNIALVLYGLFMPQVLEPLINVQNPYLLLLFNTVLSTLLILVFAEFLPKALFNAHSNRLLEIFALPSGLFYFLFFPVVSLMMGVSNFVMYTLLKAKPDDDQKVFDKVDLNNYIRERTETTHDSEEVDHEIQIFRNALEFGDVKAREFMVPRTEVVAMDVNSATPALLEEFVSSNLSKIIIYKDTVDNVIGYVHSFELFKKPQKIREILRPVGFIPESMAANEILNLLIKERRSLVVVLDEFGGTAGLVTMEDVVEELFGEIDDEHDTEELLEKIIDENTFLFSARQEIDRLNEKFDLELPESENYSTLGGLVINHLESIPKKGEELTVNNSLLKVESVSNAKIEVIKLTVTHDN
jgi:CBS domain containing-hemolysin-like protein